MLKFSFLTSSDTPDSFLSSLAAKIIITTIRPTLFILNLILLRSLRSIGLVVVDLTTSGRVSTAAAAGHNDLEAAEA
jgi:hypothetical protein